MDSNLVNLRKGRRAKSAYERFISSEAVPVIGGFGIDSLYEIPMAPWARQGCDGAYLQFFGSDGALGMYAGKISAGGATLPERHLFEEMVYILQGEGVAEIQQRDRVPENMVWRAGSLFSPPLNALHRLINYSDQPALFLAVTTAPVALDHYRNEQFIFQNDFVFNDRYDGAVNYFRASDERYRGLDYREWIHQTNFIPDVSALGQQRAEGKRRRIKIARFEMAKNSLVGQLVEWPVGRYRRAHCRSGGVALLILRSSGYSLMWPSHLGTQPYKLGLADQVVRLDWAPGSIFSPPPNWFHQHFNTGAEPAQTLAFFCGSEEYPLSWRTDGANAARFALSRQAGALDINSDDPSIRRMYEAELVKNGIMPRQRVERAAGKD
jgi:oxalate decarboxylase/phosphoglucose isomerase-like protein (cupin superfamily)